MPTQKHLVYNIPGSYEADPSWEEGLALGPRSTFPDPMVRKVGSLKLGCLKLGGIVTMGSWDLLLVLYLRFGLVGFRWLDVGCLMKHVFILCVCPSPQSVAQFCAIFILFSVLTVAKLGCC